MLSWALNFWIWILYIVLVTSRIHYNFYYKLYKSTIIAIVQTNSFKVERYIIICIYLEAWGFQ